MAMKETRKEGPRGEKKEKKKYLKMKMTRTIKSIPKKEYRESTPLAPTPKPR